MKVEVKSKKGLRTVLSVIVDKKSIQTKMNDRLNELQKEVALKGFRPGKVPSAVIKSQFGKSIYGEVVDKILREFIETCSKKRGEIKAELISAKDLSESDVENIKNDLSNSFNSKIKLTYKNDKSLVGGLILQVGSTMIDTSIKNKLQKIEKQMVEA